MRPLSLEPLDHDVCDIHLKIFFQHIRFIYLKCFLSPPVFENTCCLKWFKYLFLLSLPRIHPSFILYSYGQQHYAFTQLHVFNLRVSIRKSPSRRIWCMQKINACKDPTDPEGSLKATAVRFIHTSIIEGRTTDSRHCSCSFVLFYGTVPRVCWLFGTHVRGDHSMVQCTRIPQVWKKVQLPASQIWLLFFFAFGGWARTG